MKYWMLVWAGLWRKKTRTIFTLLSIVTAFFLFGMLQGLNLGIDSLITQFLNTSRLRVAARINQNEPLPVAHVARIAALPGVASVTPLGVLVGSYQQPRNVIVGLGVDVRAWLKIYPEFRLSDEQLATMLRTRDGVVVGAAIAERYSWKIGDRIPLQAFAVAKADGSKSWELHIVGIYDIQNGHEWATNVLMNYDYLNEARVAGKNTVVQIIVRIVDPLRYAQIAQAIDELFANSSNQTRTQNERDFIQSNLSQIGDISFFFNGIVGAVLFTLLFLTANTMMQAVRERTAELAVLKTLGFSDGSVLALILAEALLLSVVAAALGLAIASAIFPALMQALGPSVGLQGLKVPLVVFVLGAGIAVLLAVASGLPPAWRAKQLKIVDALAAH